MLPHTAQSTHSPHSSTGRTHPEPSVKVRGEWVGSNPQGGGSGHGGLIIIHGDKVVSRGEIWHSILRISKSNVYSISIILFSFELRAPSKASRELVARMPQDSKDKAVLHFDSVRQLPAHTIYILNYTKHNTCYVMVLHSAVCILIILNFIYVAYMTINLL